MWNATEHLQDFDKPHDWDNKADKKFRQIFHERWQSSNNLLETSMLQLKFHQHQNSKANLSWFEIGLQATNFRVV